MDEGYASSMPPARACCEPGCCNLTNTSYVHDRLPNLRARGQSSAWDRYLDRIYGTVPPDAYPLDLKTFGWFYFKDLPLEVMPSWLAPACTSAFGHAWHGWPGCGEQGHGLPEAQPSIRKSGALLSAKTCSSDPHPLPPHGCQGSSCSSLSRAGQKHQRAFQTGRGWRSCGRPWRDARRSPPAHGTGWRAGRACGSTWVGHTSTQRTVERASGSSVAGAGLCDAWWTKATIRSNSRV